MNSRISFLIAKGYADNISSNDQSLLHFKLPLESFRSKNFNFTLEVQFQLEKP